jgi:hypothetical protein
MRGLDQPQRERKAGVDRATGVSCQIGRNAVADDRIAPLVQLDELRQQVSTQAVSGAGDGVDLQARLHRQSPSAKGRGTGSKAVC